MTSPTEKKLKVNGPVLITANRLADGAVIVGPRRTLEHPARSRRGGYHRARCHESLGGGRGG